MLEVFYDKTTGDITAWMSRPGRPIKPNEEKVVLEITPPEHGCEAYRYNASAGQIELKPTWKPPLTATRHWARVKSFQAAEKPIVVTREFMGQQYDVACYASQDLKDAYDAGNLQLGDYVIVDFIDGDISKPFASQKVYKSW